MIYYQVGSKTASYLKAGGFQRANSKAMGVARQKRTLPQIFLCLKMQFITAQV
jgi:hypothetical protein